MDTTQLSASRTGRTRPGIVAYSIPGGNRKLVLIPCPDARYGINTISSDASGETPGMESAHFPASRPADNPGMESTHFLPSRPADNPGMESTHFLASRPANNPGMESAHFLASRPVDNPGMESTYFVCRVRNEVSRIA